MSNSSSNTVACTTSPPRPGPPPYRVIVSGTEDTNAPYRDTKRIYDQATGPKIVGVLDGTNHYTSPRFWAGPMTAFLLTHLAGDAEAEEYAVRLLLLRYTQDRGQFARRDRRRHILAACHLSRRRRRLRSNRRRLKGASRDNPPMSLDGP